MQVEGTCSGKYGFLICVTGMGDVSKGQIREGLGTALFNVHYSCLVLRPHKGEVMDCVVTSVSKVQEPSCALRATAWQSDIRYQRDLYQYVLAVDKPILRVQTSA